MKFLFIQKNSFPAEGPMIISALLKQHGFAVDLFLVGEEKDLINSIKSAKPTVVGISCFTGQHQWAIELCQQIKKQLPEALTLLGGPHPTYYPEIIEETGVDLIARGEAEYAILELMQNLKVGKSINQIKGLWVKINRQQIFKNDLADLPCDLDALLFPDRTIYYKYKFLKRVSVKQFLSGRGCPYRCTFCANNLLHNLYQGRGQFIRRRSPGKMVEEIIQVREKYGLRTVSFTDDVFINNKKWLEEFLPLYKNRVNLPFMCNVTANLINEDIIILLKENGCYGISLGIESGDQEIRFKILKKFITDEQIIKAGELAKKYSLILKTYNILGLPGETIDQAFKTLILNAKIKSNFAASSLLQLFPKYEITEYAQSHNYLATNYDVKDVTGGIYYATPLKLKDMNQFINLQKLFFLGVKLPFLIPLIKKIIKSPPNFLFNFIGKAMYGFFMSRVHRLTIKDMINYALHIDPYDV